MPQQAPVVGLLVVLQQYFVTCDLRAWIGE